MSNKKIGEVVQKVFEEAGKKSASGARSAKANQVVDELWEKHNRKISYRTVERAFKKYIDGKDEVEPQADSVDLFCRYLGFENFMDYVKKNPLDNTPNSKSWLEKNWKWLMIFLFGLALTLLILNSYLSPERGDSPTNSEKGIPSIVNKQCMTWADSLFVAVSCDTGPFSKYWTKVEPLDQKRLKNMCKVKVNAAYKFFSKNGNPLIWYYKNENNEHEFFTAPGLHPVTDETLKKITPYIIQTYVPIHLDKKESFLPE